METFTRTCTNPEPGCGGKACDGSDRLSKECDTGIPCPRKLNEINNHNCLKRMVSHPLNVAKLSSKINVPIADTKLVWLWLISIQALNTYVYIWLHEHQVHASRRPARADFLKLHLVDVDMHVSCICVPAHPVQFMSHAEGTSLLFMSGYFNLPSVPTRSHLPTRLLPSTFNILN